MIKKILLIAIIIASGYGIFFFATQGLELDMKFMQLDIPKYEEVKQNKNTLDSNVSKLNTLNTSGMQNAIDQVELEIKNYETKKQEYDLLALTASEEEIAEANKIEMYLLDYLWIRVGNYAADNNVKFKMTPVEEEASLIFDITGSYISIINFIYDLENDRELDFTIEGIVIEGGSSESVVKANFKVEDVNVVTSPNEEITNT